MKTHLYTLIFILAGFYPVVSPGQSCDLVSSLNINTGYDHKASVLLTSGQPDNYWQVTALSAFSASMYPGMPSLPYQAITAVGIWPTRTSTSEWISFIPGGTYTQPAVVEDDSMWVEYSRDFRLCSDDTLSFNLQLSNDNYCERMTVDGTAVPIAAPFSQPAAPTASFYSAWTTITPFTMALTAGTHRLTFRIHNYNVHASGSNPTGMTLTGNISSSGAHKSIVGYAALPGCSCSCSLTVKAGPHDTTVCRGTVLPLMASGASTYSWTPAAGLDNPSVANPNARIDAQREYVVTGSSGAGCSATDTVRVSVFTAAVISVSPADTAVCIGAAVPLTATGGITYTWFPGRGFTDSTIASPVYTVSRGTGLMVIARDMNGCNDTGYTNISIMPGASIYANPEDTIVCISTVVQLHVTGAAHYQWYPSTGLDNDTSADPHASAIDNMQYIVEGWDSAGCAAFDTVTVQAFPAIRVHAAADKNYISPCSEEAAQVTATGAKNYSWEPRIYCDNPNASVTYVHPPHTLVFTVTGTDDNGCISQDTITIYTKGNSLVQIPNSFTPNDDGLNDNIKPLITCDFILDEFCIYDRWGEQIFCTTSGQAWDGTYNGSPAAMAVYYYYVKGHNAANESKMFKGDITLIR